MSFLALLLVASALAYLAQFLFSDRRDLRRAMRHGLALGLLFTGTDHFVNGEARYLPMMPGAFGPLALPLVWLSGVAELAGAIALLVPARLASRLGWPRLHRVAGVALAVMFAILVIANVNMAIQGTDVKGLAFGQTYLLIRPFLQPIFIAWALYACGVIGVPVPRVAASPLDPPSKLDGIGTSRQGLF